MSFKKNHKKIPHFLLINSETVKTKGLCGKMPLLYFLFSYANTYEKQYYADFAFEILEDILVKELSIIENDKKEENSRIAGTGWSLIQFIEVGYFESDDLEDILSIIDKAVFLEVERVSRTDFEMSYMTQLINLGLYLISRVDLLKSNEKKFLEVKEYLFITFFELTSNISHLPHEKIELFGLCQAFFKDKANHNMVSHFCVDGIKKLNEIIPKNFNNQIIENYKTLLEQEKFETILSYNLFFPDLVKDSKVDFLNNIERYADKLIKTLYQSGNQEESNYFQKIMICAISMINYKEEIKTNSFEFYLLGLLINSIDHE